LNWKVNQNGSSAPAKRSGSGDVIHYQDGNNRTDIRSRFLVTMLCVPGKPMLTLVDEDELAQRKDDRAPRPT
jgi:hypothetical protein